MVLATRRVLLIEPDVELAASIAAHLRAADLETSIVPQEETLESLPGAGLVIIDEAADGLDRLKAVRASSDVPVIVLGERPHPSDKVRALALGADDHLTKPFDPAELVERARARLRRPALVRAGALEVGPLQVDIEQREVRVRGRRVALTPTELGILMALVGRPGVPVTRGWLLENVLEAPGDGNPRALDVHVSRLRRKLGALPLVETVWGVGYRLAAPRTS